MWNFTLSRLVPILIFTVGLSLMGFSTHSYADSVMVMKDPGVTTPIIAVTQFITTGADMVGMFVTASFTDLSTQSATWTTSGSGGAASGSGFSLAQTGDTFLQPWTLQNSSGIGMTRLLLDAGPGQTALDTTFMGFGTPNSALGLDFSVVSGGTGLDILATYRDQLAAGGNPPVGDIFRFLSIDFTNPGGYASGSPPLQFLADTDTVVPIPEPSTILLMGSGLLGLVGYQLRRRKQTP